MLSFIDLAIVLSVFMLLLIFFIVCGFFEEANIARSMNNNINTDSTIAKSTNDNINTDSTITRSMNNNINMDRTIARSMNNNINISTVYVYVVIH
jgi:hypothetical protein